MNQPEPYIDGGSTLNTSSPTTDREGHAARRAWPRAEIAAVLIAAGAWLVTINQPLSVRVVAGVIGLGAGAGLVIWSHRRRQHGAERLRTLALKLRDTPADADANSAFNQPAWPDELEPLAKAIASLAPRVRGAVRDGAKKARNLEGLIDAIDEPLLATDNAQRVLLCNRSAERLLDHSASGTGRGAGLIGRDVRELFTQSEILEMHACARDGQIRRQRVRVVTALGPRVFQVTASPMPAAFGDGVFGAVLALRDVTELAQIVQVQTDFVANASHELRTPVAAIRGAAETMQTAADDSAMTERLRGMILANAVRLEEMLRDLLDLSRMDSSDVRLELADVDLETLGAEVRGMVSEACDERRLTLSVEIEPGVRRVHTDRTLITLIVRNLVENAAKFAHEGTTIRLLASAVMGGRGVKISVIDVGIGIPLAAQERVFERYYQVDPSRASQLKGWRRGTGLGLAIVKHAAQTLGGRAWLTSVWGQGTTVNVEFPLTPAG